MPVFLTNPDVSLDLKIRVLAPFSSEPNHFGVHAADLYRRIQLKRDRYIRVDQPIEKD